MTCVIFALLPALQLSRTNQLAAVASTGGGPPRQMAIREALVVGQLMMATILLVGAGLLAHSFIKLAAMDKGYDASNVVTFQLLVPDDVPISRKAEAIDALLTRLRARPNVQAAGFARHGILLTEEIVVGTFVPPGRTLDEMQTGPQRPEFAPSALTSWRRWAFRCWAAANSMRPMNRRHRRRLSLVAPLPAGTSVRRIP